MPFKISPQILSHYWWYPFLYLVGKVRDIRLVLDQDCKTDVFLFPIWKARSAANIIPVHNGHVTWKMTVGFSYDKFVLICIFYMVPPQPYSPFLHPSRPFVWILPVSFVFTKKWLFCSSINYGNYVSYTSRRVLSKSLGLSVLKYLLYTRPWSSWSAWFCNSHRICSFNFLILRPYNETKLSDFYT